MAREVKEELEPTGIDAADLNRVLREAIRQKRLASEASGLHGKIVSNAAQQYGIERTAFSLTRRLLELEPDRRQAIMRAMLDYWHKAELFSSIDLFDEMGVTLETILNDIRLRRHNMTAAPAASDPINATLAGIE